MNKRVVLFTGAGMSRESGLKTFRDSGGYWETYDVTQVASREAWEKNPELVLRFYNERRKAMWDAHPHSGHIAIAGLEKYFDVRIITQNVDDLHERAGSSHILHLHGELRKARSTANPELVYILPHWELKPGDLCELGSQLRPHIVWFGEPVPHMKEAADLVNSADIFAVIGTSLSVYPAANLIHYVRPGVPVYVIDPGNPDITSPDVIFIREKASAGMEYLTRILTADLENQITHNGASVPGN